MDYISFFFEMTESDGPKFFGRHSIDNSRSATLIANLKPNQRFGGMSSN
jgi:hypothetical protein